MINVFKNKNYNFLCYVSILFSIVIPKLLANPLICETKSKFDPLINKNVEFTFCKESNSVDKLFDQVIYHNSYNQVESQLISSQLDDLLGIKGLFSKNKGISGFPDQRIVRDSELVWEVYNKILNDQLKKVLKNTDDIFNGFDTSLGK